MGKRFEKAGFTIVELLIVMAMIAGLTSVVLVTYPGAQKSARDARRRSDLNQYRVALETYANKYGGLYPSRTWGGGVRASITLCGDLGLTNCPDSPTTTPVYWYQSDGESSASLTGTRYTLWAQLERPSSPATYYLVCSSGKSGEVTSGIPTTLGACPF